MRWAHRSSARIRITSKVVPALIYDVGTERVVLAAHDDDDMQKDDMRQLGPPVGTMRLDPKYLNTIRKVLTRPLVSGPPRTLSRPSPNEILTA
jgi:hypothetical protein